MAFCFILFFEKKIHLLFQKIIKMISPERGVAYFGHIPHGFDEKGMREYLSQFGEVTNLRIGMHFLFLARSGAEEL